MHVGHNGIALVQRFEGCYSCIPGGTVNGKVKPKPVANLRDVNQTVYSYRCSANVPTIGWGNTMWADGTPVADGDECTLDEANQLFYTEIDEFAEGVARLIKTEITQNMFDALVCFAFNVGLGNLKNSTLLKVVNAGQFDQVREQFMRWNKAGGKELPGLTKRRSAEADLFETPDSE